MVLWRCGEVGGRPVEQRGEPGSDRRETDFGERVELGAEVWVLLCASTFHKTTADDLVWVESSALC